MEITLEIYECNDLDEFNNINNLFLNAIKNAGFKDVQDDTSYALPDFVCRDNGNIAIFLEEPYTQTLKDSLTSEQLLKVKFISPDTDPGWFPNKDLTPNL